MRGLLPVAVEEGLGAALGQLLARLDAGHEIAFAEERLAADAAQEAGHGRLHLGAQLAVERVVHEADVVAGPYPRSRLLLGDEESRLRRHEGQRLARSEVP